jgi:hypothetical protein
MSTVLARDRTLPRLLAAKAAARSNGVLQATRGKLKRVFCLEKGWLVFGASNLIEEQLEEYLVRQGMLSPGARAEASVRAAESKTSAIADLIQREVLTEGILRDAMEGLIGTLLTSCLEWPDGDYRFAAGKPDVSGKVTVRLSPVQHILEHARHYPTSIDAVRARLGPPDIRPQRTDDGGKMLESITSGGASRFLLEGSDGSRTLGELLADCPATEEETLRSLYGLFLVGALDETAAQRKRDSAAEAPLTEEECVALLGRAEGADHYGVLGLDRRATHHLIRDAYYSLARRYHPDRFRSGELCGYLGQMEKYFTQVTEAYNTLYHSDLRKDYDQQLDEVAPDAAGGGTAHLARQNFLRAITSSSASSSPVTHGDGPTPKSTCCVPPSSIRLWRGPTSPWVTSIARRHGMRTRRACFVRCCVGTRPTRRRQRSFRACATSATRARGFSGVCSVAERRAPHHRRRQPARDLAGTPALRFRSPRAGT